MIRTSAMLAAIAFACPAMADTGIVNGLPPYTEAVLPIEGALYAVAIGPGGPGEEFGLYETNGGLYRLDPEGGYSQVELSDGLGLRNPTGMVQQNGQIVLVDGNQVVSVSPLGDVNWRRSLDGEGVFFYDVEALNDEALIVSDFGRGKFVSIQSQSGEMNPYLDQVEVSGLARFEISGEGIYAISWGADDAWNSAVYQVTAANGAEEAKLLADGFGNLESIELVDGHIVVGGYRGHENFQDAKLFQLDAEGDVSALSVGAETKGVSDIFFDGGSVWINYFYDASYEKIAVKSLLSAR
ncbi:hypothetical protein [uncultured Roseovarius sp.]|uniref:hypothetical protein n=1 Tax=uncultured Roseovarius sp. TaxID=293344 RepID=UPI0026250529|nr:hypothetical protein [uncultured Roseovarius sp.]